MNEAPPSLASLGLKRWPFGLTPSLTEPPLWAGRAALRRDVDRTIRRLAHHDANSLHLLWADFGAGKTHTLLYIKNELESSDANHQPYVIYTALPKQARSFVDIYRAIARAIPRPDLITSYEAARKLSGAESVESELRAIWPAMFQTLHGLARGGDVISATAESWLRAEPSIRQAELSAAGIVGRLRTSDDAALALQAIVRLFQLAGRGRVIILIDEFQRIEILRQTIQQDVNAGLHSIYNSCSALSIFLSFSFGVESNIKYFLNSELLSRADPSRIRIPAMSITDVTNFLRELIDNCSDGSQHPWDDSLYEHLAQTIGAVASDSELLITPRKIIKLAGYLYLEASMDIDDNLVEYITSDYVQATLDIAFMSSVLSEGEDD